MNKYTWRTDDNGLVWVTTGAEPAHVLLPGLNDAVVMDRVIARWEVLALKHAAIAKIPPGWILSMIWRESAGNPQARNRENPAIADDDGVGLLQLTIRYFAHGLSDAQLMDPETNVSRGAAHIADLRHRFGDFPRVSAAFNAGSPRPSDKNPFGMVSTGNHIEAEVSALNYYVTRKLPPEVFQPWRVPSTDEVLAEVAATTDAMLREMDLGGRQRDTDQSPPPDDLDEPPTSPQTPLSKSQPPSA